MGGSSDAAMSLGAALFSAGFAQRTADGGEFYRGRGSYELDDQGYEDSVRGALSLAATPSPQRSPSPRRRPSLPTHLPPKNLLPEPALCQRPNVLPPQRVVRLAELV